MKKRYMFILRSFFVLLIILNTYFRVGASVIDNSDYGLELFEINDSNFLPIIYSPSEIYLYNITSDQLISKIQEINLSSNKNVGFILTSQNQNVSNRHIYLDEIKNPSIYFNKKLNTKFEVNIKNINNSFWIFFNSRYHPAWNIFQNDLSSCKNILKQYNDFKIYECDTENKIEILDLFKIFKSSLFKDAHYMVNGYANGWYIDVNSSDFQKHAMKNSNGTHDLDIVLWFIPQSYFYLGLVISAFSIFFCISYLLYQEKSEGLIIMKPITNEKNSIVENKKL